VTNTIVTDTWHAGFGMPLSITGSARVHVAPLRAFPVMTGVVRTAAEQKCALVVDIDRSDRGSVMTDVRATGGFPGTSAWSPPI